MSFSSGKSLSSVELATASSSSSSAVALSSPTSDEVVAVAVADIEGRVSTLALEESRGSQRRSEEPRQCKASGRGRRDRPVREKKPKKPKKVRRTESGNGGGGGGSRRGGRRRGQVRSDGDGNDGEEKNVDAWSNAEHKARSDSAIGRDAVPGAASEEKIEAPVSPTTTTTTTRLPRWTSIRVRFVHRGWWTTRVDPDTEKKIHTPSGDHNCESNSLVLTGDLAVIKYKFRHLLLSLGHLRPWDIDPQNLVPHAVVRAKTDRSRPSVAFYQLQNTEYFITERQLSPSRKMLIMEVDAAHDLHCTLAFRKDGFLRDVDLVGLLAQVMLDIEARPECAQEYLALPHFCESATEYWARPGSYPHEITPPADWRPAPVRRGLPPLASDLERSPAGFVRKRKQPSPFSLSLPSAATPPSSVSPSFSSSSSSSSPSPSTLASAPLTE